MFSQSEEEETWEEANLKNQDDHPLITTQVRMWGLKAVSETAEGVAETMIHPSGLLETTPFRLLGMQLPNFQLKLDWNLQMKDVRFLWCFHKRLWNSKIPCKQSNTRIICFEIWARVNPGYNSQNLGNKSVIEKLLQPYCYTGGTHRNRGRPGEQN